MSTRRRAKAMVMTPRYRPKQQTPKKGKGSYRRQAKPRIDHSDRGFFTASRNRAPLFFTYH
ncbi:MAG: alternative ribosome rescue factor ArfA [Pseudomonadota bacterium]